MSPAGTPQEQEGRHRKGQRSHGVGKSPQGHHPGFRKNQEEGQDHSGQDHPLGHDLPRQYPHPRGEVQPHALQGQNPGRVRARS